MPDTLDTSSTEMVRHSTGRFVTVPVLRTNLHDDLVRFLTEVLDVEEPEGIALLAMSLTNNVLDAYLDANYWLGRQAGYGEHHRRVTTN